MLNLKQSFALIIIRAWYETVSDVIVALYIVDSGAQWVSIATESFLSFYDTSSHSGYK